KIPKIEGVSAELPAVQKIPNWFGQLKIFIQRDVKSKLANRQYIKINLALTPLLALFIGYFVKYYDAIGVEKPVYTFYNNDNVLGLNISSAFDSAVTIYILIPILIIPQLLLSGVVISFDKFNPKVGTPNGIPLLGEMMASRWAFEAYMVTQFKDNPLEKKFYK